jgi:hypothetical protein
MKFKKTVLLISALFSFNAFADNLGQPQVPTAPVINFVPAGTVIPMLNMKFDCGDCKVDNKIKALVEGSYLDQLELEKAKADDVNLVTYTVTKYRKRGGARFFLGALAGVDNITGSIECKGEKKEISDTAISAVNGIEAVARNVGKDAYKAMREYVLGSNIENKNVVDTSTPTETNIPAVAQ